MAALFRVLIGRERARGSVGGVSVLIYVVGPSGAGKDTLLDQARQGLAGAPVVFAHRYITRPAEVGGENHVALSPHEFALRERAGSFALVWRSHGHAYGIGVEVRHWLGAGLTVIVNGSRSALSEAAWAFPRLATIEVTARRELLRARLRQRGRESEAEIEARLDRAERLALAAGPEVCRVDNSGSVQEGAAAMVRAIGALAGLQLGNDCVTPSPTFHGVALARPGARTEG